MGRGREVISQEADREGNRMSHRETRIGRQQAGTQRHNERHRKADRQEQTLRHRERGTKVEKRQTGRYTDRQYHLACKLSLK